MNYAAIKTCDIANGPGVRTSVFVSGCTRHCKDCFQPQTWSFDYGEELTREVTQKILDSLAPEYVAGLTVLGGEPFEPRNQAGVRALVEAVRAKYPHKSLWAFTGYTLEPELLSGAVGSPEDVTAILRCLDVLVDGPFVAELKDLTLRFRGSSNQRLIDMKKTLISGGVVLWDDGAMRGGMDKCRK